MLLYKSQGVTGWFDKYENGVNHRAEIIGECAQGQKCSCGCLFNICIYIE